MMMANTQDILELKDKVIQVSLDLASVQPWNDITMHDICDAASCEKEDLFALFPDKASIIMAYSRKVDLQIEENLTDAFTHDDKMRDRLFDVFMERFDIYNDNREAVISIINGLTLNAGQGMQSLCALGSAIEKMTAIAGVEFNGLKAWVLYPALSAIYLKSMRSWVNDHSIDMSATMAALDHGLGYFEKISAKMSCA